MNVSPKAAGRRVRDGVTGFGLVFTPTFYVVSRALGDRIAAWRGRPVRRTGTAALPAK